MLNTTLLTERLLLRVPRLEDAPNVQHYAGDYDIAVTTSNIPHPYPDGAAEMWIARVRLAVQEERDFTFAMTLKDDDRLIGVISIHPDRTHKRAEIGYWLGKPFWNQGITSEAAARVVRFGFEDLGLYRIQATYFVDNIASRRVMDKVGMTFEGVLRGYVHKWDVPRDLGMCSILRHEWDAQQRALAE